MRPHCLSHSLMHAVGVAALIALMTACAGTVPPPASSEASVMPESVVSLASATASAPAPVYRETGMAGWYGKEYHGRKTASGEVFDMNGLSAAHRTLPLGTVIRVTNLENSRSIILKVIDRGPFVKNRVLDLSYGAATELGFVARGVARVSIESQGDVRNAAVYTVQAALFSEEENARMLKERLAKKFELVTIVPYETNVVKLYRVRVGSYASLERAEQIAGKLTLEGLEPLVLRKD